jgi:hypothetical protein
MSGSKGECDSFSVINDAPIADKAGTVGDNRGMHEVSCVCRSITFLGHLLCNTLAGDSGNSLEDVILSSHYCN